MKKIFLFSVVFIGLNFNLPSLAQLEASDDAVVALPEAPAATAPDKSPVETPERETPVPPTLPPSTSATSSPTTDTNTAAQPAENLEALSPQPSSVETATTNPQDATSEPSPTPSPIPLKKTKSQSDKALSLSEFQVKPQVLRFNPEKNGVKVSSPQFTYSIDQSADLVISGAIFSGSTFRAVIKPQKLLGMPKGVPHGPETNVLFLTAPLALGQEGTLEIVAENGQTLLSRKISKEAIQQGATLAKSLPPSFWEGTSVTEQTHLLLSVDKLKKSLLNANRKGGYRFCWNKTEEEFFFKACTPYYRYSPKDRTIKLLTQAGSSKAYLAQKETKTEDSFEVKPETPIRFLATSKNGYSLEFYSQLKPLQLLDFVYDDVKQTYFFTGHSAPPSYPETKFMPGLDPKSLTFRLQWQATIAPAKDYWVSQMPKDKTYFIVPGKGGGLFRYNLEISKAPTLRSRITLNNPPTSTYSGEPKIRGSFEAGAQISAPPPGKLKLVPKTNNFSWLYPANIKGEDQEAALIAKENNQEFKAYYSLFRGYSGELSLRLAGVLSKDLELNILGELAYNQWFESLFGWENYYLSQQRWGLSFRNLTSLTTFQPQGTTTEPLSIGLSTLDLKYRLTPGLWERDETWGVILGAESITINKVKGSFGGGGLFWARSMPLIFDRIISWFPFMDYPKWVDMELVYYAVPLATSVKAGPTPNFALNFHGKVLWKKYFFGEAGFGVKSYSYKVDFNNINVQALYGTAGLGFNF